MRNGVICISLLLHLFGSNFSRAQETQDHSGQVCSSKDTDSMKCALCMLQGTFGPAKVGTEEERREAVRMAINVSLRENRTFCSVIHSPRQFFLATRLKHQSEMKMNIDAAKGAFKEGPNDFCQMDPQPAEGKDIVKVKTLNFRLCKLPASRPSAVSPTDAPTANGP